MTPAEQLGKKIRELRMWKNLSQQQLADLMFVTRKAVGNWENGKRTPDAYTLQRLATALDVEVMVLLEAQHHIKKPAEDERHIIIVDRDPTVLKFFVRQLTETLPDEQIWGFRRPNEALLFAKSNRVCVAFMEIDLGENRSGIDLACGLMEIYPKINIIFVTSCQEYAFVAWELNASGYVMKPMTAEKIASQLSRLRYPVPGLMPENEQPEG
ncbi:MAG: helix-turn-helix domain-containing protein [Clostridia bacterium]|nr:helix-turn-helix domain-containing protein [Clostridia bacterium]